MNRKDQPADPLEDRAKSESKSKPKGKSKSKPKGKENNRPICLLYLCTGNAARSVMAEVMTKAAFAAPEKSYRMNYKILSAGTHALEGHPPSRRTEKALQSFGLTASGHKSKELTREMLKEADLVISFALEHNSYVRQNHPDFENKTATLKKLAKDLPPASEGSLSERIKGMNLVRDTASKEVSEEFSEEVEDPAGGEDEDYQNCAEEIYKELGVFLKKLD